MVEEFDWNDANINKNWIRHKVSPKECEEVFINRATFIFEDERHSQREFRFTALGKTFKGRLLFISFTKRQEKIRVISARDGSRKERRLYEEKKHQASA